MRGSTFVSPKWAIAIAVVSVAVVAYDYAGTAGASAVRSSEPHRVIDVLVPPTLEDAAARGLPSKPEEPPRSDVAEAPVEPEQPVPDDEVEPACNPPEELEVLFIGNSYTIMHDLPGLVEALGEQAGIDIDAEMLARGGQDLEFHATRQRTAEKLAERDWDVVVLQGHSLDPLRDRERFLEAGQVLVEMVRDAGAYPVLFQTWARKAGHNLYNYYEPTGGSPEQMQRTVSAAYDELAERTGAEVVEVGRAWRRIRTTAPEHDPYASDAAHPGELGSYLTANVFFAALTDVSPVGNVGPLMGLDSEEARLAQKHAAVIVQPSCDSAQPDRPSEDSKTNG